MNKVLIILLIFSPYFVRSQTFNRFFDFDGYIDEVASVIVTDSFYYFVGGSLLQNSSDYIVELTAFQLSKTGDLIDTLKLRNDSLRISLLYNSDNLIIDGLGQIVIAAFYINDSDYDGALISLDGDLDLVSIVNYPLDSTEVFASIMNLGNNNIIVGQTNSFGFGQADYYVAKVDQDGIILSDTSFGGTEYEQIGNAVQIGPERFILCGQTASYAGVREFYGVPAANAHFMCIDTNFNVIWEKVLYTDGVDWAPMVKENGYFYYRMEYPVGIEFRDYLERIFGQLDLNTGDLLWQDTLKIDDEIENSGYIQNVNDDGFVIMCDVHKNGYPENLAKLIRYDTYGNLMWERTYYSGNISGSLAACMAVDSDGSFIFGGTIANLETQSQDAWFLKLNPDGCLDSADCGLVSGVIDLSPALSTFGIHVYPNPASQEAYISVANTAAYKNEDLVLNIYDLKGNLVYTASQKLSGQLPEFRMDVRSFSSGSYLVQTCVLGKECGSAKLVIE
ncbi:MAG: T9SS type A sorting domain-containing protein [Chitinophagales bacterium]|nr:T9SS type A sorting domain-containing protein [Chitinophagales bacterium]